MTNRRGEKIGWTGGWLGGFIWVAILSVVFLVQGQILKGLVGIALTLLAVVTIVSLAPWRFPQTPYWKLMVGPYAMFFLSIVWGVWSYGGLSALGLSWWNLFLLLPLLFPLGSQSKRTWADGETHPDNSEMNGPH